MYQHVKQINPLCCGAACMQMVYRHFGLDFSQESIWDTIKRPAIFSGEECCPNKMQIHFHRHGLCSLLAVDIIDLDLLFTWIVRHNLAAIVNYAVNSIGNHFVLFEHLAPNGIIVQDPDSNSPDTLIPYEKLINPQVMLITVSTYKAKCLKCNADFPACALFSWLYARHVARCPYCGEELIYTQRI